MRRVSVLSIVIVLLAVMLSSQAKFDGRWQGEYPAPPITFDFKTQGKRLTGSVDLKGLREIHDGEVDGATITFHLGPGSPRFTGELTSDKIAFVMTDARGGHLKFNAKRAK